MLHLTGSLLLLLFFLLRLPFCFDPPNMLRFDGFVPVAGALALGLVAGDMAAFHSPPPFLPVWCFHMTLLCFALAPGGGPRPGGLSYLRCLDRFLLPSAIVML